ncbi:MAG: amino acid-binding protein [Treponema sp.]|nr:amino acid-binding protein [Treponema sp.]
MTVNQISIFLENKPESLSELTDVLAKNNVNMRALSLADTSDFGIAHIITDDCAAAEEILKANDYIVKTTGVIALEIPDEAGSLNKILKLLAENGRNIEYMYGFTGRKTNSACMIIRCTNMPKTEEILEANGIHTIGQEELKNI